MPTLEILAWDYPQADSSGWNKGDGTVFERMLDDQELVSSLYERFNKLDRGIVAHGHVNWVDNCKHRYLFRFYVDGKAQVYMGLSYGPAWQYSDQTHRMTVERPGDILRELHESIGLPWEYLKGYA
jgi:hypothetical protein